MRGHHGPLGEPELRLPVASAQEQDAGAAGDRDRAQQVEEAVVLGETALDLDHAGAVGRAGRALLERRQAAHADHVTQEERNGEEVAGARGQGRRLEVRRPQCNQRQRGAVRAQPADEVGAAAPRAQRDDRQLR